MTRVPSIFAGPQSGSTILIRMASLLAAIAAGVSTADCALGQEARGRSRPAFDDGNSDSESYPFDSAYDADYGRYSPADRHRGQGDRSRRENRDAGRGMMGLRLRASDEGRVFVNAVFRGDPADRSGLRPGDKVLAIDGYEIGSLDEAKRALRQHNTDENVEFIIARNGRTREIDVPLNGKSGNPAEAIAVGAEDFTQAVGETAAELGSGVRRFSQTMRQDIRGGSSGRTPASVRDPYDRFSYDSEGVQSDIDDETSDFSGQPQEVIEIDVLPPDQVLDSDISGPQTDRGGRHQSLRQSNTTRRSTRSFDPAEPNRSGDVQPKSNPRRDSASQQRQRIEL